MIAEKRKLFCSFLTIVLLHHSLCLGSRSHCMFCCTSHDCCLDDRWVVHFLPSCLSPGLSIFVVLVHC